MSFSFVILAGGTGSRTRSSTPKVLQEIAGKPAVRHVIDLCKSFAPKQIISVVSLALENNSLFDDTEVVVQKSQCGTADAVLQSIPYINGQEVIILCADTPLVESRHIKSLMECEHDAAFIAMRIPAEMQHTQYGRVIIDDHGNFQEIVEHNDIAGRTCENLANSGIYKINRKLLGENILKVELNRESNEYHLTDLLSVLLNQGTDVHPIIYDEYYPFHGINTMYDISIAEAIAQDKLRKMFMQNGVRLLSPDTTYFSHDTEIDNNVVIEQNVIIKNNVEIRSGAVIKAFSYLEDCMISESASIGPFARIRGASKISECATIGNFVEIKASEIGNGTKIKHLSYIGDTKVGSYTNIGAGTITCNFDGVRKHRSTIGYDVMIGANSALVSPVNIGDMATVGAGSVITKDVPSNALAIARNQQINKECYKRKGAEPVVDDLLEK
jgi:bifunctional UDP-N-acetylglucosamine pyrophosphorylase/glucosamine-1-phosphate N-acetyltransferase